MTAFTISVLPVPVGPARKSTPLGLVPDECCMPEKPSTERLSTETILAMAGSWPFTRRRRAAAGSSRSLSIMALQRFSRMPYL